MKLYNFTLTFTFNGSEEDAKKKMKAIEKAYMDDPCKEHWSVTEVAFHEVGYL